MSLGTRDAESENSNFENDDIFPYHHIMDWGPTCDHLMAFVVPCMHDGLSLLCALFDENFDECKELIVTKVTNEQIIKSCENLINQLKNVSH